ncbi:uncharacterized protein LOC112588205 [Harpegnathos saltator]|uniref:uncharacterized protein LOC112588205 n=1 Tax=Harpegnathos saltator TaxID=610380 RepID=UPI000DBEEC11|nr:uncharacterized protein LOC112588205 [Harpegnathos saltator]
MGDSEELYSQFHVFHDHGQMFVLCLICQTVIKSDGERLQKHRMVCNDNKQASNNKAKKRKVTKSNTTNMHSSLNDSAQTASDNVQKSSNDGLNTIDEALAKFFFGCNISFSVIESVHFKNFISILNPTYKLPTRKTLSTSILDKFHTKMMAARKESLKNTESVLLIDGWKNSPANTKNIVCVLYNASKKQQVFLESYDFSGLQETAIALKKIVNEVTELWTMEAMDLYGTTIYAVVSDNVSSMIAMGKSIDLWHTTCNSHSANLLAKSVVQKSFAIKVNALLKEIKNPNLEVELIKRGGSKIVLACETRWCSHRDSFKCALKNLDIMRTVVQEKQIKFNTKRV